MQEYPTETRLILLLKEKGQRSLQDLSQDLGISKMGVLNHIKQLESRGLIRRIQKKGRVGRPYYLFAVTEDSKENLANSNAWMLQSLVSYLKETGHSDLMEHFLKDRYEQIRIDYEKKLSHTAKGQKIQELVRMREDESYFPVLKDTGHDSFDLQEFNCPIYQIARYFGIACNLETRLFSSVLDMDVESTHRQVDGHGVCRFIIRPRSEKE